jgi:hypothetical protein
MAVILILIPYFFLITHVNFISLMLHLLFL